MKHNTISALCISLSALVGAMLFGTVNAQMLDIKMVTDIRAIIPQEDPYCRGGYPSIAADADNPALCLQVAVESPIPQDVVDWVLLELRSRPKDMTGADNATKVIARKPAFLLSNGRVVDAEKYASQIAAASEGNTPPFCEVAELETTQANCPDVAFVQVDVATEDGALYLVVRHRNHLDIISNSDITTDDADSTGDMDIYTYDFSGSANQAFSSPGETALKDKGGIFVMYGGDVDGNGTAEIKDYTDYTVGSASLIGTSLYHAADTNFGGIITPADYSDIIAANQGKTSYVPIPAP